MPPASCRNCAANRYSRRCTFLASDKACYVNQVEPHRPGLPLVSLTARFPVGSCVSDRPHSQTVTYQTAMAGRWLYRVYCKQRAYEGASRGIAMGCGLPLLVVLAPRPDVYVRDNELKFPVSGAAETTSTPPRSNSPTRRSCTRALVLSLTGEDAPVPMPCRAARWRLPRFPGARELVPRGTCEPRSDPPAQRGPLAGLSPSHDARGGPRGTAADLAGTVHTGSARRRGRKGLT